MSIIINGTEKHYRNFSVAQKLACREYSLVINAPIRCVEDLDVTLSRINGGVKHIIVDPDNLILNNDILNAVSYDLVTLDVELFVDENTYYFKPYEVL